MKKRIIFAAVAFVAMNVVLLLTTNVMLAQGPGGMGAMGHGMEHHEGMGGPEGRLLPPGIWWHDASAVTAIGLTPDQVKHIDQIFLDSRVQLIRMHASLEEEQLRLEVAMKATPFDSGKAMEAIDKTADMRAELEKTNAKMLLTIRGVLSADQWTKLRSLHHGEQRGGEGRGKDDDRQHGAGMHGGRGSGGPPPSGVGRGQTPPMPPPPVQ